MKEIPLEKLTKDELIALINRHDWNGRIKRDANLVYYEARDDKNKKESDDISKAIDKNLAEQGELIPEFNNCKDIDQKVGMGNRLVQLGDNLKKLNSQWEKSYKKGNAIFSNIYGS